jgi:hypothetical protein
VWDGNYYALAVIERLGLEDSGGMVRMGPVHFNQAPLFWVRSPRRGLWGTLEEISRFGEVLGKITGNDG